MWKQQVSIRPNPAKEGFFIHFAHDLTKDVSWQLIRPDGSKVLSGECKILNFQNNDYGISFKEELVTGIYYLNLSDGKEQTSIPVIIK